MSSMVIWRDDATGVVAEWRKGETYSIRVEIDDPVEGKIRGEYSTEDRAISAAKRLAEKMRNGPVLVADERAEVDELMRRKGWYASSTGSGQEAWRLDLSQGDFVHITNMDGATGDRIDEEYRYDFFNRDGDWLRVGSGSAENLEHAVSNVDAQIHRLSLKPTHPRALFSCDRLSVMYADWLASQHLPQRSADELIHDLLTPVQRRWLSAFILMWEAQKDIDEGRTV